MKRVLLFVMAVVMAAAPAQARTAPAPAVAPVESRPARTAKPCAAKAPAPVFNRAPLLGGDYAQLPLGAVRAEGWLLDQLQRQATGLTGHLDELYPEVVGDNNAWLGGDGDTWERGPYWIDGLLPLAYLLQDEQLIAKARKWAEAMISSATPDGYFGNGTDHPYIPGLQRGKSHDWWPKMVALKILQQYYDATGDERVLTVLGGYFRYQKEHLPQTPLGHWSHWAEWRAADNLGVIYWLYNKTGEQYLLELADLIHSQATDFTAMFHSGAVFRTQNSIHCVNLAQGFKTPVVWWQQSHDAIDLDAPKKALEAIRTSIGFPTGLWAGDELLHFGDPTRGSEFCTAVEMMYSLEEMFRITGDPAWADLLERVAYNALPTQATDAFDARQYYQQVNQIACTFQRRNFVTEHNGTDVVFGLLNGYPCCTCNMHQGWPKLTRNLWLATRDGGLTASVYAPCTVTTELDGKRVTIREDTFYPFSGAVAVTIELPSRCSRARFPLEFRIPAWCKEATIEVKGERRTAAGGTLLRLEQTWRHGDTVVLTFPMDITTSLWYDDATVVERGPLLYALRMEERWERKEFDGPDRSTYGPYYYEVTSGSPWNFGLYRKDNDITLVEERGYDGSYPWNVENAPVRLRAKAAVLKGWTMAGGNTGPVSYYYEDGDDTFAPVWIDLIPYGCTTLRIAEFPTRRK